MYELPWDRDVISHGKVCDVPVNGGRWDIHHCLMDVMRGRDGMQACLHWMCLSVSWGSVTCHHTCLYQSWRSHWPFQTQTQMSSYKTDGAERSSETKRKMAISLPCFHMPLLQKMIKLSFICTFSVFILILVVNLCKFLFISVFVFFCASA